MVTASPAAFSTRDEGGRPPGFTPEAVIAARGLTKRYGQHEAVAGIDIDIHRGEIVALLGPNGAGKTTTVEILEGFRRPTSGEVSVLGCDPAGAPPAWRERVGVVLQESGPEPGLTVTECLRLFAGYYQHPRDIAETLGLVGLAAAGGVQAAHLSGGQRRRLDFALALIGDPELIFLDEPTTGFDPSARRVAWDVIAELRALGKTIVLTTHYMDEAEYLADRIIVIARGKVVAQGTPGCIGGRDRMDPTVSFRLPPAFTAADLPGELSTVVKSEADGQLSFRTSTLLSDLQLLAAWALGHGLELADLEVRRLSLEEVYLQITSESTS